MGDATEETFELEDGPVDSQEPLTTGYGEKSDKVEFAAPKDTRKDIRSFCLSVFNLMNAILGSGILGLGEAMKNLGVAVFYLLLLLTACLAGFTINLLLAASKASGETSYEGLAVKSWGMAGKVATSVMIVIHCLGAMCSYVYIVKAEMPEVMKVILQTDPHSPDETPFYLEGWFLMLVVVLLVIVPLSSMKDIRFLGYSSAFGMCCMLFFTVTIVVKYFSIDCPLSPTNSSDLHENGTDHEHAHHLYNKSEEEPQVCEPKAVTINSKSAYAVPTMIFSFMCHASMLPIYQELRRRSPTKMRKVAGVSISLVLVLYLLSASFGYFTFYNYVESELLLTYSKIESSGADVMIIVSRVMVLVCVTLSTPLLHYPCRKTIVTTFLPNPERFNWFIHLGVMAATLTLTVVLVLCIPNIRDIFGLAGATSSASLLIVFPCAFFLKLTKRKETGLARRILVLALLAFGVFFMILSVSLIIVDWATEG